MRNVLLAMSMILAVGACGDDDDGGGSTVDAAVATIDASTAPTITLGIAPDQIAAGGDVVLTVTVTNFTLEPAVDQPNAAGHGHYHVYLDDASGGDYLTQDFATTANVTIPAGTAPGAHTLKVIVSNNDHSQLDPVLSATVPFTVL